MLDEDLPANAEKMGRNFMDELKKLSGKHGIISEIRGIGLMIGIQLAQDKAAAVKTKLFENGWLVGSVGASVIRLLPPLIITKEDIDAFAKALDEVLMSL
jgi:4-aminobutyrate aminotransferase-like enzyme